MIAGNSRLRTPVTIFDVFCVIRAKGEEPTLLQKYPEDFNNAAVIKSVLQFADPCPGNNGGPAESFCFTLTDSRSQYTFGYCRTLPRSDRTIIFVSALPWDGFFESVLAHLSQSMERNDKQKCDVILSELYCHQVPVPGACVKLDMGKPLRLNAPHWDQLPRLDENLCLLEFCNTMPPMQLIALYSSLLKERRIIFTGSHLSQVSSCVMAASTLLFPMHWQSLLIPILPASLIEMLHAPMPYLIGVPKRNFSMETLREIGDVMVIDLDTKTLNGSHNDVNHLPEPLTAYLKEKLKAVTKAGDRFSRIFLRANSQLFSGFKEGLVFEPAGKTFSWNSERFIAEQPSSVRPFLEALVGRDGAQYFERFIDEQLDNLNKGFSLENRFEGQARIEDTRFKAQIRENAHAILGVVKDSLNLLPFKTRFTRHTRRKSITSSNHKSAKNSARRAGRRKSIGAECVTPNQGKTKSRAKWRLRATRLLRISWDSDWDTDPLDPLEQPRPNFEKNQKPTPNNVYDHVPPKSTLYDLIPSNSAVYDRVPPQFQRLRLRPNYL
ncbi:unnamed protein product, partial [Mesorhabditis spiculigera]